MEEDIEFVIAGEDAAEAFESAEEPFDVIALTVELLVELPGFEALRVWRNYRFKAEQAGQTTSFVTLIGHVHDQSATLGRAAEFADQLPAFGAVAVLAGREPEADSVGIIRGNQMNLGVPSSPGFADRLSTIFFSAPVPSG